MPYKKRYYKRSYKKTYKKKRNYRRRYYKRRYYKKSSIKKPEIHIIENSVNDIPFNNATYGVGVFRSLGIIGGDTVTDIDEMRYKIDGKVIDGAKIRLKYLYIKGYIVSNNGATTGNLGDADDFNCKLMVFRWKRNTQNSSLSWTDLINNTISDSPNLSDPSTWTEAQRLQLLYMQDWKNDIKINFYKRVKNLYRKYDDANNIIPFKIRVPLYDCVLTCDSAKSSGNYIPRANPSTNGLYFTFLSNRFNNTNFISYKYKIYYTDY